MEQSLQDENWDLVIRPQEGWIDLDLMNLWHYRDLVMLFVRRDFVAQFKQTILGASWFVIQPLLTTIVFAVIFGNLAGLSTDHLPKMLFYLSGNVVWLYFSNVLTSSSNTFVGNAHIFGKVYFPRLVIPVSLAVSQLIKFMLQFGLFLAFWIYYAVIGTDIHLTPYALLFPLLIVIMGGLALGLGILFSSMTTKYRDLRFLLAFGVRLAMYATPVIFPLSSITGGRLRLILLANPMTPIIETFRLGFLGQGVFHWGWLGYSAAFAAISLFVGIVVFNRVERTFMDTV